MSGELTFGGSLTAAGELEAGGTGIEITVGQRAIQVTGLSRLEVRAIAAAGLGCPVTIMVAQKNDEGSDYAERRA